MYLRVFTNQTILPIMKTFKRILILIILILIGGFWYARPLLKVGAGYAAKMGCSCHYLQGRSLDAVHEQDLIFSVMPMFKLNHAEGEQAVKASFLGLVSSKASYINGQGCILDGEDKRKYPPRVEKMSIRQFDQTLPQFDTLPKGLQMSFIQAASDFAFSPESEGETRAIAVLYDGHLVYEDYAKGFNKDMPLLGWSMSKSIVNAVVGIMVKNGYLKLEQDHLFSEWENDERAKITLNNLMHMNSGLEWNEAYGNVSDATRMLFFSSSMGDYALNKPVEKEPDTKWIYSSGTTNMISKLIRQTLENDEQYYALFTDSLFAKVGMHSAILESDRSGNIVGSSFGWATARDWAKFGQLYLQDGVWNGERILPQGWVAYSREKANGSEGVYGAQIWLKRKNKTPNAPDDIFIFSGFQDQRVFIIPSRNCVIVRLGLNTGADFNSDRLIMDVLEGLPENN